jgi:hypothetical protein
MKYILYTNRLNIFKDLELSADLLEINIEEFNRHIPTIDVKVENVKYNIKKENGSVCFKLLIKYNLVISNVSIIEITNEEWIYLKTFDAKNTYVYMKEYDIITVNNLSKKLTAYLVNNLYPELTYI